MACERSFLIQKETELHFCGQIGIRWAGHVACLVAMNNAHKIFVRQPEQKRPLGRP